EGHRPLRRRRREPVVRPRRRELGGREAGEGAREHGEELALAEPGLRAEGGRTEERRDAVDERGRRDRPRLLRRSPDQLRPAPAEEQRDRGPLPEPRRIRKRREAAAGQHPVERPYRRGERAGEVPEVPDERRDEPEPDPEVDPDEHRRRVLEEL